MKSYKTKLIFTLCLLFSSLSVTAFAAELSDSIELVTSEDLSENAASENAIEIENITDTKYNTNAPEELTSEINYNNESLGVNYHTEEEVCQYLKNNFVDIQEPMTFTSEPLLTAPYDPGQLSDETLNSSLRLVNNIRYIAGLSDNLTLDEQYTKEAQAAALVCSVNGYISHTPPKPSDMSEELYQLGYKGASSSNLGRGHSGIYSSILDGYMEDSDSSNINQIGHRRWILYPGLMKTGFGCVNNTYSMSVTSGSIYRDYSNINVAWPAQETPLNYFTYFSAWSLSTGNNENISDITVTLTRIRDNKSWNFSGSDGETDSGYFNVSNNYYGSSGCIIFRPSDINYNFYKDDDRFHVEITGTSKGTIAYDVHFFEVGHTVSFETNGGTEIAPIEVKNKSTIQLPSNPKKEGFIFNGWYTDPEFYSPFYSNRPIENDLTLYAKWRDASQTPTLICGQKVDIKSQYFNEVADIAKYRVVLTDTKTPASQYAVVSTKGILTCKKAGNITIIPQYKEGKNYYDIANESLDIIIYPKPTLKFTKNLTYEGQTINAYDFFNNEWSNYGYKAAYFTTNNQEVADINNDGTITAGNKSGTVNIVAYLCVRGNDNNVNTVKVSAKLSNKAPAFAKEAYSIKTGQKLVIGMKNVTGANNPEFTSEDESKFTVDLQYNKGNPTGKCIIQAYECGDYYLTATIDEREYTCIISVTEPVIKKAVARVRVGKTTTVALKNTSYKPNQVEWFSEDESVATVGTGGKVMGLSEGTAVIYTETGGVRNECVVTVY